MLGGPCGGSREGDQADSLRAGGGWGLRKNQAAEGSAGHGGADQTQEVRAGRCVFVQRFSLRPMQGSMCGGEWGWEGGREGCWVEGSCGERHGDGEETRE